MLERSRLCRGRRPRLSAEPAASVSEADLERSVERQRQSIRRKTDQPYAGLLHGPALVLWSSLAHCPKHSEMQARHRGKVMMPLTLRIMGADQAGNDQAMLLGVDRR